jgi:hypothetical protein
MLVILLWKHQRQSRAICNGLFWLMACLSFSISSYLYALGWAPNQKMILWMILIPTLTSELLMKVLDWFRVTVHRLVFREKGELIRFR